MVKSTLRTLSKIMSSVARIKLSLYILEIEQEGMFWENAKHQAWTNVGIALSSSLKCSWMFHYRNKERNYALSFMKWILEKFFPFQCFDNRFSMNISVLISLLVYIMNDSWLELAGVSAMKFQLSYCSQGHCSINSRVYWRHCKVKCHHKGFSLVEPWATNLLDRRLSF